MNEVILYSVLSLSVLGILAAIILYFVAQKFKVEEDPRIDLVEDILPAANCGGCGYAGCRNFAESITKADELTNFFCPPGGDETMNQVAKILGKETISKENKIAVLRCNGCYEHRKNTNTYTGINSCTFISLLYGGETDCHYGCLGLGECVEACHFDAMYMDKNTGLPIVIEDNCIGCKACVKVCPKNLLEMRKRGPKNRRIFVSCMNENKGALAKKSCRVACIGCMLCMKECPFDAITIDNFLAYIDDDKCRLCRKCVPVCPTNAIHELNFPVKKKIKTAIDAE